ncbi:MAG: AAA family ATPase [Clostridiales Family XIII bacterium]|jgi:AAA+ ATPase superfamily predicted ATPase|nr:AAA family ATPase [Clostridiales Family XIII bacterium]
MNIDIIGRKEEQAELREYAKSKRPEFVVIYGRRRVGKTFLVRQTFHNEFDFSFTGIASATMSEQLEGFSAALRKYGKIDHDVPKNWFEAFDMLTHLIEQSTSKKKVIFLDEMPWMDTKKSKFVSALEHFWNGWASGRSDILLIACGSATSWMTNKLFLNKGGLYNRVTQQILLEQFTLAECREYFERASMRVSDYDILESYMIFGGIPYYLSLMNKKLSIAQNVDKLCFGANPKLRNEYDSLYQSVFAKPERYIEVVTVLSSKRTKGLSRDDIVKQVSFPDGGNLSKILRELEQSGFIRKYPPFDGNKKGALYQLCDFFTLFFLKYMQTGKNNDPHYWSASRETSSSRAWKGYAFEQVCLAHIPQIKRTLSIAGVISNISAWRSKSSTPGAQIDLLIDRNDGVINMCEMKYSKYEYTLTKEDKDDFERKERVLRLETKTKKAIHRTLVTPYGIKDNSYAPIVQSVIDADGLFS